jgi:hypothetical protein
MSYPNLSPSQREKAIRSGRLSQRISTAPCLIMPPCDKTIHLWDANEDTDLVEAPVFDMDYIQDCLQLDIYAPCRAKGKCNLSIFFLGLKIFLFL